MMISRKCLSGAPNRLPLELLLKGTTPENQMDKRGDYLGSPGRLSLCGKSQEILLWEGLA